MPTFATVSQGPLASRPGRTTGLVRWACACWVFTSATPLLAGPLWDRLQERREARVEQHHAEAAELIAADATLQRNNGTSHATLPSGSRAGFNLAYGPDPRQRLDVYLPATTPVAGVVFMVHGGAWRTGSKTAPGVVTRKVQRWLPRGVAVVSINYRLLPQASVSAQANDVRAALAFAQAHAGSWGVPAERFVLMGHSAGAHLVALVSANPAGALAAGARPWLGTVVLDSAAMDVPALMTQRHAPLYDSAFGQDPAFWHSTSPIHHLTPQAPPVQLVCSTQRPDHPCRQAEAFARRAHSLGVSAQVLPQARSHGEINTDLGLPGPYTQAVEHFMAGLHPALAKALATP